MAVVSHTLVDLAKRVKDGNMLTIAEVLQNEMDVLDDAQHFEANGMTNHTYDQRVSEPEAGYRMINAGAEYGKSIVKQEIEPVSNLEIWSRLDAKLVELAPNQNQYRSDEDLAFVNGLAKKFGTEWMYGDPGSEPMAMKGIANRLNLLSMANVWGASGTANRTSIVIVLWGPMYYHLLYPRGAKIGIQVDPKPKTTVYDDNGKPFDAYQTKFTLDTGMVSHIDKCVQRIANIDATALFSANLVDNLIIQALNKMPGRGQGARIYMNSTLISQFEIHAKDKTNVNYGTTDAFGVPVTTFRKVPLRLNDQMLVGESAVS